MKKVSKLPVIILLALAALLAVSVYGLAAGKTAKADNYYSYDPYSYYFEDYDVVYDVAANREISVTERITVHFTGSMSTGLIKDIPVNGGEQVRDVSVCEISGGTEKSVPYDVYFEETDFLSVDIGDYTNKTNKIYTYLIKYKYCLTRAQEGEDALFLNVIGIGRNYIISKASVKLILPDGYKNAKCVVGSYYDETEQAFTVTKANGKTVLELKDYYLPANVGISFKMNFESGSLSLYSDFTPYLFSLIGIVVLFVLILLKLFVFNKNRLTPVVNYEAPDKMDPLMMGKLIDNRVNSEDVTSLIYYWAGKGYIKINLDDKNDPAIIRIRQELPETCPAYEKLMYNSLFKDGDLVKPSQLRNKFYTVVQQVTVIVNKQTKGLYDSKSIGISLIFAALGGLILGIVPMALAFMNISSKVIYFVGFAALIPAFITYAITETVMYYKLKFKKSTFILCVLGLLLICFVSGLFYAVIIPSAIISLGAKIVLFTLSCLIWLLSVTLISRTKRYTEKLNDIIGFKNFITLAEKDQLEMMLEDDPQFYYHILPYAQVLGVTDKWEEKFESITMEPPRWLTGNMLTTYIEFRILNNLINSSLGRISSGMISRPSSSGSSGGGRGGFGGGHVGGGHGGGGFRGR